MVELGVSLYFTLLQSLMEPLILAAFWWIMVTSPIEDWLEEKPQGVGGRAEGIPG